MKITYLKEIFARSLVVVLSFLFIFAILEIILRHGIVESYSTIWISPESYKIRHSIEKDLHTRAKKNEKEGYFYFNDHIPTKQKITEKRIIVLGDSFVFGVGLKYGNSWPHKLEQLIKKSNYSAEVLAWGAGGWSSKDQFVFFKNNGLEYNPDLLLIGFVDNDPEELMEFSNCNSKAFQIGNIWKKANYFYSVLFIDKHLVRLNYLLNCEDHIKRLYSDENLALYEKLLVDFKTFLDKNKIPFLFILTPSNYDEHFDYVHSKIISILSKNEIRYVDTYPEVVQRTSHIPLRQLWANVGDRHPGSQLTDIFSEVTMSYLEENGFF